MESRGARGEREGAGGTADRGDIVVWGGRIECARDRAGVCSWREGRGKQEGRGGDRVVGADGGAAEGESAGAGGMDAGGERKRKRDRSGGDGIHVADGARRDDGASRDGGE